MAYGNWGAFVYRNGQRQTNREDNTPYKEDDADKTITNPYHASLGSGPFRICGYKSSPFIFWDGVVINAKPYQKGLNAGTDEFYFHESEGLEGELNGYKFEAAPDIDPESVYIKLIEPDGTIWETKCGYCIGAGHED